MSTTDPSFDDEDEPPFDYQRLSAVGDDEDAWDDLDPDALQQVLLIKCLEYGLSQDPERIPPLRALYEHAMTVLDAEERLELQTYYAQLTEEKAGQGAMGLMMFLTVDTSTAVCSSAALNLSVLLKPPPEDPLAGPRFVINTLVQCENDPILQGSGLAGVLLLGDKRVMPLLRDAWDDLDEDAQLEMTKSKSGVASEGFIEFWLDRLEAGVTESVFGSIVAAIAKLPVIAQVPWVLDIQRQFPAYADGEPMVMLRKTSFADYLEQIRPRLDALERAESEPKLIPNIAAIWSNPADFIGTLG